MYQIEADHEVAIVGGGTAGLSAALMLARARVPVCVIDAPGGTSHDGETHNWLTNDGADKAAILTEGQAEVARYPDATFREDRVTGAERDGFGYTLSLASGGTVEAKRLVLSTGAAWKPDATGIEGFDERFGRDIFTCPYCHGYEQADRRIALIGTGEQDADFAKLLANWTGALDYISHDGPAAEAVAPALERLSSGRAFSGRVARIEGEAGAPVCILDDGSEVAADAVFLADRPGTELSPLAETLGIEKGLHPQTGKVVFKTDAAGRTPLGDVFLVGDARTGFSTLAGAANEGMLAGFMLSNDVIESRLRDAGVPVAARDRAA